MNILTPTSRVVGAAPLFRHLADDIGLVDLINRMVSWDRDQCRISPGERLLALVLDVLLGKSPLYRFTERWATTDVAILIGAGREATDFTDDSLGRALDKLARAHPARVFSAIAAQAYLREEITLDSGHWDSTSRSVTGEYAGSDTAPVHPAYGHSKDHRSDLKQILLTLFVNREGVPRFGTVESGQRSDKTLHAEMLEQWITALEPEQLAKLLYIADSALVTGPNLKRLDRQQVRFVSRCPESFGIVATVKQIAWAANRWQALGTIGQRRDAAHYWASEQTGEIEGLRYRLVVYRSSTLDRRRTHTLDREISRSRSAMERAAQDLQQQRFACVADAEAAVQRWQDEWRSGWCAADTTISEETVHRRPGRPRKDPRPEDSCQEWRVAVTIGAVDATRRQRELERRGTFVLITTVPDHDVSTVELLREYKGQISVERHFHFVKDPLFVDALFLKKAERIEALGYVLLVACLLYSLLERRLRRTGVSIPSPSRRWLTHPTGHEVVRLLESLQVAIDPQGQRHIALDPLFHPTLEAILTAVGIPDSTFTIPPMRTMTVVPEPFEEMK